MLFYQIVKLHRVYNQVLVNGRVICGRPDWNHSSVMFRMKIVLQGFWGKMGHRVLMVAEEQAWGFRVNQRTFFSARALSTR
jgi:hypothetical protein